MVLLNRVLTIDPLPLNELNYVAIVSIAVHTITQQHVKVRSMSMKAIFFG